MTNSHLGSAGSRLPILGIAGLVVLVDQVTKAMCLAYLPLHSRSTIVEGYLALTYVRNRGMAFGLFNDMNVEWLRWALVALALVAVAVIWMYARHESANTAVMVAFGCILGGAFGNLIDRVRFGYVVDFILAHWGSYEWPAFNVADSAITIGGIVLFLTLATEHDRAEPELDKSPDDEASAESAEVTHESA